MILEAKLREYQVCIPITVLRINKEKNRPITFIIWAAESILSALISDKSFTFFIANVLSAAPLMLSLTVSFHSISLCSPWKTDLWAREFLSEAVLSPVSTLKREIPRHLLNTSVMVCVSGSSVAAFPHLALMWLDFKSQPAPDKLYLHRPGTSTSICLADGLCSSGSLIKFLPPCLCTIIKTLMFYAACYLRSNCILTWCMSVSQVRQSSHFKGWAPCCAILTLALRGSVPAFVSLWWQDAGHSAWSTSTIWLDRGVVEKEVVRRSRAGQSRSVYLLFFSALTARDRLALLNWALSAHIAALKLPDGWEGIHSSCCRQKLLHSNGTITQVGHACVRG